MVLESNYNDGGLTAAAPFFNDWDETKKYLQMLFTPGRALQARELTQLQTMLQVQIDRFGSHIFKNGSPVGGGTTTTHSDIQYIRLDPNAATDNVSDYSTLVGSLLVENATGITARVVAADTATTDADPYPVLFIQYTSASLDGLSSTFTASSELTTTGSVGSSSSSYGGKFVQVISTAQASNPAFDAPATGNSYLVSISEGIFFVDGFFAIVDKQSYAPRTLNGNSVRMFSATPTTRVGLITLKSVVDIGGDSSLGDPATGSPNYAAPGAQRLKFDMTLSEKEYTDGVTTLDNVSSTDFIELLRVVGGDIRKRIKYPIYSDLEDTLARRTYDESGSYTVRPFKASVRESRFRRSLTIPSLAEGTSFTAGERVSATTGSSSSSSGGASASGTVVSWDSSTDILVVDLDSTVEFVAGDYVVNSDADTGGFVTNVATNHIDIGLDPGKAYIYGREFETISTEFVPIEKALEISESSQETTNCSYGSYFICDELDGLFDINEQETVYLYSADNSSSSSSAGITADIGTAKIKHVLYDTTNDYYRLYVYDVVVNSGESLGLTERIVSSTTGAIARIDDTNGKVAGSTVLKEKTGNTSIFNVPSAPLQGLVTSPSYYYRVYQTGTFNGSGQAVITIPTAGDDYQPASTGDEILENYMVVNTTTGTDVSSQISTVSLSAGSDIATISFSGGTTSGQTFASIAVAKSTNVTRTKTLVSSHEIPLDIALNASNEVELGIADVIRVVSVLDAGNSDSNVTSRFTLDTGQRDNIYDYAKLKLIPGSAVVGPFTVTVDYYEHTGTGPLTINSYSGIEYTSIPDYTSPTTGNVYKLRDCVDFRPIKDAQVFASSSSSSSPGTINTAKVSVPYNNTYNKFVGTYSYYNDRIDKIILTKDLRFESITGVSSSDPIPPTDRPETMTLYTITVPGFTSSTRDVGLKYVDNRRYTMKDIGVLDKRISNLEYYTSLSLLEQSADDLQIKDVNGESRFKNGIVVDSFQGHQVGDVTDPGYACSMDFNAGELRPRFVADNIDLEYSAGSSTNVTQTGDIITLTPSSIEPVIEQTLASTCISVNPFNVVSWIGDMKLSPMTDTWVDTETRPNVQVNLEGGADAWEFINNAGSTTGFGTEWNDWETIWTGEDVTDTTHAFVREPVRRRSTFGTRNQPVRGIRQNLVERSTVTTQERQTRSGITTSWNVEVVNETVGDRVINVSIIPFMRAKTITATCTGLKPRTIFYPYFDDENVADLCNSPLQSNATGDLTVTFNLPGGRFRTGDRLFRVTDSENNDNIQATSVAEATYTASGTFEVREEQIISTRRPVIRRRNVSDNRVVSSITQRDRVLQRGAIQWLDPIAESFLVDANNYPNGFFLASADLFFKAKDDNLPVTVEIRPSVNGYPHSSAVLPFASKTLQASEVNISDLPDPDDASSYTRFTFDSYVYLSPGEYHIVIRSNSDAYCAYIAEMGQIQLGTTNKITQQPYAGSLFKSQNASTWTAEQSQDLTFRLNRCVFPTSTIGNAIFNNAASDAVYDVAQVMTNDISFRDAPIRYDCKTTPVGGSLDSAYKRIQTNQNLNQTTQKELSASGDFVLQTTLTTSDGAISPVIDVERTSLIAVENIINNSTTGETAPVANTANGAAARYITRRVNLAEGLEARDIKVFITANKPAEADIKIYYKALPAEDDTPLDELNWTEMVEAYSGTLVDAATPNEYIEYEFKTPSIDENGDSVAIVGDYSDFQTYVIKIVMLSSNTSVVPRIKDLRAIAVL